MFKIFKRITLLGPIIFAFLITQQATAQDTLIKNKIENFSIMGISLNTPPSELDSLLSSHPLQFTCKDDQGSFQYNQKNYIEVYKKCKATGENIKFTITHSDGRISSIHFKLQSQKNHHEPILDDIKTLNKDLLAEGKVQQQSYPRDTEKDAFFYRSSEMAVGMSDTDLALRAPAQCVSQESTIVGLHARFRLMPGLNDTQISVSNGRSHLC